MAAILMRGLSAACQQLSTATTRVWIAVYSRMAGQFIGSAESLRASGERASVWFLARMCPDVPSLMFKTMKGLFADWAFVRPGHVLPGLVLGSWRGLHGVLQGRRDQADA